MKTNQSYDAWFFLDPEKQIRFYWQISYVNINETWLISYLYSEWVIHGTFLSMELLCNHASKAIKINSLTVA